MRNFLLGLLLAFSIQAVLAVEVEFTKISARDLYACAALSGIINNNQYSREDKVRIAMEYGEIAMKQRGR